MSNWEKIFRHCLVSRNWRRYGNKRVEWAKLDIKILASDGAQRKWFKTFIKISFRSEAKLTAAVNCEQLANLTSPHTYPHIRTTVSKSHRERVGEWNGELLFDLFENGTAHRWGWKCVVLPFPCAVRWHWLLASVLHTFLCVCVYLHDIVCLIGSVPTNKIASNTFRKTFSQVINADCCAAVTLSSKGYWSLRKWFEKHVLQAQWKVN